MLLALIRVAVADPNDRLPAVYLLIGQDGESCASAIAVSAHAMLTNSHVVEALCPFGRCSDIQILRSTAVGQAPVSVAGPVSATVARVFGSIDIAELHFTHNLEFHSTAQRKSPRRNEQIMVVGYPGCKSLQVSHGMVVETGSQHFELSALGNFGSSGSAVIDAEGGLVGVVDQSRLPLPAIASRLSGANFELRAVRFDLIERLRSLGERESALLEALELFTRYRKDVVMRLGSDRIMEGIRFLAAGSDFARAQAQNGQFGRELLAPFLFLDASLSELRLNPGAKEQEDLNLLVIAMALESRGLSGSRFEPIDSQKIVEVFSNSFREPYQRSQLADLVEAFQRSGYRGLYVNAALYAAAAALIFCVLSGAWLFSLGAVFVQARGGIVRKIMTVMIIGLLLWPLSLLVLLALKRRARSAPSGS